MVEAAATTGVFLCADDFAMTNGISRAIVELAEAGLLSATSAIVTSAHWPAHATWLARLRGRISTGLHLNLTLGASLGVMPTFAPERLFPPVGRVTTAALRGVLPADEIAAEIERQLTAFEREMGFPPDHIDGHQHVHALPVIRTALLGILARRYPAVTIQPLLRAPADEARRIIRRGTSAGKSMTLSLLTRPFGAAARGRGFSTNDGFAGVTGFGVGCVKADFAAACRASGPRHMVMCHPGFVDDELMRLDPVRERRQKEFETLVRSGFPAPIWRPTRSAMAGPIHWPLAWTGTR